MAVAEQAERLGEAVIRTLADLKRHAYLLRRAWRRCTWPIRPPSAWSRMWQWNIHMPGPLVEHHDEADRAVDRHVERVLPRHRADRLKLLVERQEEEAVQVERVRPLASRSSRSRSASRRPSRETAWPSRTARRSPGTRTSRPGPPAAASGRRPRASRPRGSARRCRDAVAGHLLFRQRRLVAERDRQHVFGNAILDAAVAAVVQRPRAT